MYTKIPMLFLWVKLTPLRLFCIVILALAPFFPIEKVGSKKTHHSLIKGLRVFLDPA